MNDAQTGDARVEKLGFVGLLRGRFFLTARYIAGRRPTVPRTAVERMPVELLARASLRGNEYAWPIDDIPSVIEAARQARLVSIGGQLQFRLPDGGTCECYWVQVDIYQSVDKELPWEDRVELTAAAAATDFSALRRDVDFMAAGREGFSEHLDKEVAEGRDPLSSMCFVWDLLTEEEALTEGF